MRSERPSRRATGPRQGRLRSPCPAWTCGARARTSILSRVARTPGQSTNHAEVCNPGSAYNPGVDIDVLLPLIALALVAANVRVVRRRTTPPAGRDEVGNTRGGRRPL